MTFRTPWSHPDCLGEFHDRFTLDSECLQCGYPLKEHTIIMETWSHND